MTEPAREWRCCRCSVARGEPTRRSRQLPETVTTVECRECWIHAGRPLVDKRPSAEINMRLLSLNRGAIHGYRYEDRRSRAAPWNKGKLVGQKPPLKLKEIWAIRIRLQLDHRARELALFNLAIDSKLRGCDLVGLRVHDVVQGSHVAARAIVMQKKTQRPVQFEITEQTRDAVTAWISGGASEAGAVPLSEPRCRSRLIFRPGSIPGSSGPGWDRLGLTRRPTAPIQCAAPNRR